MRCRFGGNTRHQNFRRGRGESIHAVVLGDPVTFVAEAIREFSEFDGVLQSIGRAGAG